MNEHVIPKILLIDLENCPSQILQLQAHLSHYSQVIICYAKTGAKIPLDWLVPLSASVVEGKLSIFKMDSIGKNSADFGLCFFAGALMQQCQKKAHFTIISNDTDLDHVVHLLVSQGCTAERVGVNKTKKQKQPEQDLDASPMQQYCAQLAAHTKARPAKKATLRNSIKNKFKETPEIVEGVLNALIKEKILSVAGEKVTYHNKNIEKMIG